MNITNVKDILGRKFGGSSLDDVQGISDYSLFKEAAVNMLSEIDPVETTRHTTLEVYEDVFDYDPPDDMKGLADIRPQTMFRNLGDNPTRRFLERFDQDKEDNDFSIEWFNGTKILRYAKDIGNKTVIENLNSLTGNGSWGGTAANIAVNTFNPYSGSGSIVADYDTGEYIENSTFGAVDLTDHKNKSVLFVPVYFPDASLATSVELRWGSSSANYFSRTRTAPQFGSFANGWNLIPFAWNGATETGTVDASAIDYLRITMTLSSSDTDIKVGQIFSALGQVRDLVYLSNYLFRSTSGTWLETPTADTDIVNLDTDAQNIFIYECCRLIASDLTRADDLQKFDNMLHGTAQKTGLYDQYKRRHPSEDIPSREQYRTVRYNRK